MMTAKLFPMSPAKLARDLRADLRQLKSRGIDPATFLSGTLVRIYHKAEKAAKREDEMPVANTTWYGQHCRVA